ncbi:hypothetical protein MPTK1_8g03120 [Marchantia polymorpha subsp. ruderalis]|uniref:Uncharacterized protein n=1 Tax=Marchantia polymorpha TaxID=3197 RepID=A0A2R6XJ63_MARPO|nr:hypothetical protein MARPO_0012s0105 [Marchantia polymorpha]BBN18516.1 hypothetical protein Mp_8g03120 [Marchantia polymorpha subsp. ruderalis]|eukprot:PTQ46160.1 hypothetical protein MARPO_0012s0105 [Marchantia polymorpha]
MSIHQVLQAPNGLKPLSEYMPSPSFGLGHDPRRESTPKVAEFSSLEIKSCRSKLHKS